MSDEFRRLLDDDSAAPLRPVLEAGLRDGPSQRALTRAARALGIGAAGLGAARAAAAAGTARALRTSLWAGLAKWGAAGLLIGGLALSPFVLEAPPAQPAKVVARSAPQASAGFSNSAIAPPVPMPDPIVFATPIALAATSAVKLPEAAPATPTVRPLLNATSTAVQPPIDASEWLAPSPATPAPVTRADVLDTEVALLDSARSALKHDDPNAALALLDRHAQLNAPSLGVEAVLLRVQALLAAGRSADARAVARAALGGTGAPAYSQRLRKLAGLPE